MKKQLFLLAAIAIFSLISCQKEGLTSSNEMQTSANEMQTSANAGKGSEAGMPFKASFNTSSVLLQGPPNLIQRVSGTGIASHMGNSTFEATSYVTVAFPPPFAVSGTRTITAANGDKLYTSFTGTSTPVIGGINGAVLHETITGGTGRFANASGSFVNTATNNFNTSSFMAIMDGTINY